MKKCLVMQAQGQPAPGGYPSVPPFTPAAEGLGKGGIANSPQPQFK